MRQNVKRTIAFAETVAMTFGNATQVKADITSRTNNIHIDTSIPISSQGETVGYEFTVEKDGYYMLYTQGEDDTYGTLYVKEGTTWKELIHDDDGDDGDSNNFLLTATLYKDKEYKIDQNTLFLDFIDIYLKKVSLKKDCKDRFFKIVLMYMPG